jgi:DNA-nicking Smr family endonuclease
MSSSDTDDRQAFETAMKGVEPIRYEHKVNVPMVADITPGHVHRRHAAVVSRGIDSNSFSMEIPQTYGPLDWIEFRREGVQYGVFRKLKQGAYGIESRLDLHGLYVAEAREAVFRFVNECHASDLRTVLILHGKGEHSETPARLKNCVAHWLPGLDTVQAFCSAQARHGGTGAVYLLLRKSARSREQNAMEYQR